MNLTVETEQEVDGRWIAEVRQVSGALAYGATREEAIARAKAIALEFLAAEAASKQGRNGSPSRSLD